MSIIWIMEPNDTDIAAHEQLDMLLAEQAGYYRERASEYEDWWFRRGRYDRGADANSRWFEDVAEAHAALDRFSPRGEILELACGTGLWSARLGPHAAQLTAVDASEEMLAINRLATRGLPVRHLKEDLFSWRSERRFDVCFFGFWLSHVPEERFEAFWRTVEEALVDGGRVFFIDSLRSDLASAVDHRLSDPEDHTMLRRLADGREFHIVKRFYEPSALERRLGDLGWDVQVRTTREFFIYGMGSIGENRQGRR